MTKKQIFKLFEDQDLQKRIVGILLSRELVELEDLNNEYSFSNIRLTTIAKAGFVNSAVTEEFVQSFRELFPPGKRGNLSLIRERLHALFTEMDISQEEVLEATRMYIYELTNIKYCQYAHYFIEKRLEDGTTRQTLREFLERVEETRESSSPRYGEELL